jgi:ABC-type branched-subunit amino acid transport system substrate-binding protein
VLSACVERVPANLPPPQQPGIVVVTPPPSALPPGALPPGPPPAATQSPVAALPAEAPPPPAAGGAAATGPVKVGLLLPLSGQGASLGQAMLDAAEMALFDAGGNKVQLLPRDTQGSSQGASDAARSAITDGARLIIGPLLAAEVEAAKPVVQGANVPMVAFSTATQLAGGGTFLMGFLPRQEIERVMGYAHAHGLSRVAVLAPRNPYGDIAIDAAKAVGDANGTPLVRSDSYDPGSADVSAAVKRFVAAGVDFDALLLPEGVARLKALAPLLPYYNIDPAKVKYLGTGLWDDPTLATEPELAGAWYAAPNPAARAAFEDRFRSLYKHPAPRLATLAYDATALAAALSGGDLSVAAIENPNGFAGLDGIFRFTPDGVVERGLAVIELHRDGNTVVDPAPTTFEQRAY